MDDRPAPMTAWRLELGRHDWAALRCGCGGSGAHLPGTFERLLSARSPQETVGHGLAGHLEEQSMLFEVAPHAVPVVLAALTCDDLLPQVKGHLLGMLEFLVAGESHLSEIRAGRPDLDEACLEAVREGIWQLYAEAASGDTQAALDVLEIADPDESRFAYYRAHLAGRVGKRPPASG
ncbi:hypothetical protein [Streptomyces zhihengii]|uniref:hypothetical protein n=1 Tax=Streptomyces zhihengii TaxID=1818004 RepID=UPI0033A43B95